MGRFRLPRWLRLQSPTNERLRVRLRFFETDQVAGIRYLHNLTVADLLAKDIRVHRRYESILFAPHDQRRRLNPPQPVLESALRNRKEKLGNCAESSRHADQRLDLFLGAIIPGAEELSEPEHLLRPRAADIVK